MTFPTMTTQMQAEVTAKDTQIRSSERIKTHKTLDKLSAVSWPDHVPVLSQGLDEIGNIEAYKAHIQAYHKWLKHGLDIQKDGEQCPYCFQDVKGNEAIQAYKQFFSAQCQALMTKVTDLSTAVSINLSDDKALLMEKSVSGNNETCAFWQAMDNTIAATIPFTENYAVRIKEYRDAMTPYNKLSDMCVSKHNDEHEAITTYLSAPQTVKRLDVMKAIRSYAETKLCTYMPELATLNPPNLGTFIKHLRDKKIEASYITDLETINDSIVVENHGGDSTADDHTNLTDDELRNICKLALELAAAPDTSAAPSIPPASKNEPRKKAVKSA